MSAAASYDDVPYVNLPHRYTHPARIAAVATLFGLKPPDPARCRVLELGCAAGANVIAMSELMPDCQFTGIDGSARQIEAGRQIFRAVGCTNLRLEVGDILAIDASWGQFDYIIAHGVYSWVPAAVRDKVLAVCRQNLAPNGVAFVSYNALPGWRLRGIVRDLMLQTVDPVASAMANVAAARAMVDRVANMAVIEPWASLLKNERTTLQRGADAYAIHDYLEEVNDPFYLRDFVAAARKHDLAYLGDGDVKQMCAHNFGPVIVPVASAPVDQVEAEQLTDFVVLRHFRSTLLVHADNAPRSWAIPPESAFGLHVASRAERKVAVPGSPPPAAGAIEYVSPTGQVLETSNPLLQAAMTVLGECWPGTIPFDELHERARASAPHVTAGVAAEVSRRELATGLIKTFVLADLTELYGGPIRVPAVPAPRPEALAVARHMLNGGGAVIANAWLEAMVLSTEFERRLLVLLDGTRDRGQLIAAMSDGAAPSHSAAVASKVDQHIVEFYAKALLTA